MSPHASATDTMPPLALRPNGGAPARRAMRRWAWRLFRREWRQQLLIFALITVAVAATVVGAGIATNTSAPPNATLGGASYAVTLPGSAPNLSATITTITSEAARSGPVQVVEHQSLATGSVNPVELRAESPTGPFARTSLALLDGHYPDRPGEVALTRSTP